MFETMTHKEVSGGWKIRHFRWWIAVLLAFATAINYLDRQALPMVLSELRKSFSVSNEQYGLINSFFLFAYGTMYAVGGRILDILGTKKGYALMIIWWSLANMLHGFVHSVGQLGLARFLLGLGEGGGFPGSAKAVAEWFPKKDRSMAFGIFNTGSSLGAVAAPLLIASIVAVLDWRWAFFITGMLGLVWVGLWFRMYSSPAQSRFITAGEQAYITTSLQGESAAAPIKIPWLRLFGYRSVWALLLVKFLSDSAWFFFIFWLPKYLNDVRGLDIKGIGAYAWIPYAMAGAGSFIGGWLSSYLLKKNYSLDIARKLPLGFAAALLPSSLFITGSSLEMAIVFFSMAMFGHQFYSTLVQTLATDLFHSRVVGSVAGLMGAVGTYGAMLFSLLAGYLVQNQGYAPVFVVAGILHPIGFLVLIFLIRQIKMEVLHPGKTNVI